MRETIYSFSLAVPLVRFARQSQAMAFSLNSIIMNSNKRKAIPVDVFMAIIASIMAVGCVLCSISRSRQTIDTNNTNNNNQNNFLFVVDSSSNKNENHRHPQYALKWNESDSIKLMCYGTSTATLNDKCTMRYDAVSKDLNLIDKKILIHFDSPYVFSTSSFVFSFGEVGFSSPIFYDYTRSRFATKRCCNM